MGGCYTKINFINEVLGFDAKVRAAALKYAA